MSSAPSGCGAADLTTSLSSDVIEALRLACGEAEPFPVPVGVNWERTSAHGPAYQTLGAWDESAGEDLVEEPT